MQQLLKNKWGQVSFITDDTPEGQPGAVILGFIAFFVQSHSSTDTHL
jgi:hypothetical protein